MKNFFLSLKTTVWILFILVCLFFIGSYMMPAHRETFSPMNEGILLSWASDIALADLWYTWWFFAALAGLALLTANTLVCSIQAVRGKWSRSEFLLRIAPQVIHLGFLFILLAHLLSATSGYKLVGMLPEGAGAKLRDGLGLAVQKIDVQTDSRGSLTDWSAAIAVYDNDSVARLGVLAPNHPVFYRGVAIYLRSLNFDRGPAADLMVVKDPGAVWALAGGFFFILGCSILMLLKWKSVTSKPDTVVNPDTKKFDTD